LAQTGQRVIGRIRHELFGHLQTLSPAVFERRRTGDLLMRLTGDIQMLRQMLVDALTTLGQSVLLIAAMIVVMFWLNPTLALLGMATVPLMAWTSWRISRQIRRATDEMREKESIVATIAHDVLGAMPIVQAFNREPIEQQRFSRQNRSTVRAGVRTTKLESKLYRTLSLASAVGLCAILYMGVRAVLTGNMTAGDLLVFISYLRGLNKPLRSLSKLSGQVAKATACGQRVAEIFAIPAQVRDRSDARALSDARGTIEFDRVGFSYEPGIPALTDISLRVAPGERIAIVGQTGAGKSTLIKLLLRFYDAQTGCVRIDGTDVRDLTIESLRRQIGWVHQDTILFGMTVAENIALGRADAEPELIRAVARRVQADEFIRALPNGYDAVLGQGGLTLSGGQRQRLALARALLRAPAILLLDEPATGLDALTRQLVEQAWMSPENRATTLVLCHRLHAMERFDRIVMLSGGRIAECGRHSELLTAHGLYAEMFAAGHIDEMRTGLVEQLAC
jgi:ABC-type multidrug transport system fused ATPase/permease subunit